MASAAVDQQVEQHLLQLYPIAGHGGKLRRELGAHADLTIEQVAAHEREDLLHHLVQIDRLVLRLFLPQQRAQPGDDLAGPLAAFHDIREDFRHPVELGRVAGQETLCGLRIAEDRRQRLGQLVRERGREHADRANPCCVGGLNLCFVFAALRLLTREHAGEYVTEELHARYKCIRPVALFTRGGVGQRAHDRPGNCQRHDYRGVHAERPQRRQVRGGLGRKIRVAGKAHDRAGDELRADPRQCTCLLPRDRHALGQPPVRFREGDPVPEALPQSGTLRTEEQRGIAQARLDQAVLV